MKLLLDTCTFLWLRLDSPELSAKARDLFSDRANEVYLSSVSAWEIAVKHAAGRLTLPESPRNFIPDGRKRYGITPLPLEEEAALHVARLPKLHSDPFDRMLICQAIIHGLTILTPDEQIARYPVKIAW